MTRDALIKFVEDNLSTRQIGNCVNLSQSTIKWWLKKYNLKTRHEKFGQISLPHSCSCGETDPSRFYHGRKVKCKKCFHLEDAKIGIAKKRRAIEFLGGQCCKCGYDRYYGALEFHHIDPKEKDKDWTQLRNWGWYRIEQELKKCALVCANCHREIHAKESWQAWMDLNHRPSASKAAAATAELHARKLKLENTMKQPSMRESKAHIPPQGKFRVIGVDTFDGDWWIQGDYDTREQALADAYAETQGRQMTKMHVYDDTGQHIGEAGTF